MPLQPASWFKLSCTLAAVLLAGTASAAPSGPAADIGVEHFFADPEVDDADISPDGRFVAFRNRGDNGLMSLSIVDLSDMSMRNLAKGERSDVSGLFWTSEKRLGFIGWNLRHAEAVPYLFGIDRDGTRLQEVFNVIKPARSFAYNDDKASDCSCEPSVRGFAPRRDDFTYFSGDRPLGLVSTRTGAYKVVEAPDGAIAWVMDQERTARVVVTRDKGRHVVLHRNAANSWDQLADFIADSPESFDPLVVNGNVMYVRARKDQDKLAIYRYNIATRTMETSPVIEAPGFDVMGRFILDDRKILGFSMETDSVQHIWFDARMKSLQQEVDALLPATSNRVTRGERSETPYVLISATSPRQAAVTLIFNTETKKLSRLGQARPGIDPARMADKQMLRVSSRDGLEIPLHLTLPLVAVKKNLPLIVMAGNLPDRAAGNMSWDSATQFLASRGYAVLSPTPRGAAGFGARYQQAGTGQLGRAVQDDVADVTRWAIAQGIADPTRICIIGTGYGGYTALMALAHDPALFRCAVSWSGSLDVLKPTGTDSNGPGPMSLLNHAANIKRPLLMAYGKSDTDVTLASARRVFDAIQAGNPAAQFATYTQDTPYRPLAANRIAFWTSAEAFLARHTGPATPP